MDAEAEDRLHVVMLPWLAMGHLIPFLELSKCLAHRGIRISFISTPRNIARVKPRIPTNLSSLIELVTLPLPPVHNLPDTAEATIDLPVHKVQYLKKAFDGLETPLDDFLQRSTPSWIIYDFTSHWLPPLASKHGVPCAYCSLCTAAASAFFGPPSVLLGLQNTHGSVPDFTRVPKWIPFPSQVVMHHHEIQRILSGVEENASNVSDAHRLATAIQGCDAVVIRSCPEFEPVELRFVEKEIFQKPSIPVGLLPPAVLHERLMVDDDGENWAEISEWLNKMKLESVVYVALGTEAALKQEEINELALGLELSNLPFFWVLRKAVDDEKVELPDGFTGRTMGRGLVWEGWAPQVKILAHPSVGVFLTHCGWNSIIEGLGLGRALVLLPYMAEQGLNARLMVSKRIGVEIPREEGDGSFTRDSVAKLLRIVTVEEEGEQLRRKAREMKEIFGNEGLHDGYMDRLVQYLKDHKRNCKESGN